MCKGMGVLLSSPSPCCELPEKVGGQAGAGEHRVCVEMHMGADSPTD